MRRSTVATWLFVVFATTGVSHARAEGADISIQIIAQFTYRHQYTNSYGIANNGTTVGSYLPFSGSLSYARSREGFFTQPISFPGAEYTNAQSVNNAGVICGYFYSTGAYPRGFLYDGETYTEYDFPNAPETLIFGENDDGDFVGSYANPSSVAFLNHRGNSISFAVPGADFTEATGINNRSQIVGFYFSNGGQTHGFFRDADGTLTFPFDYPGATDTFLTAINDREVIVGMWRDANNKTHGLVLELPDVFTSFDYPDSISTELGGINDKGFISASFDDPDGLSHGFIARANR